MKTENKLFDSAFRKKSHEIKIKPSANVWQNIDSELSQNKRFSLYSIIAIAASILIIVGFVGLFTLQNSEYSNADYHVQQVELSNNQAFDVALMKWVRTGVRSQESGVRGEGSGIRREIREHTNG